MAKIGGPFPLSLGAPSTVSAPEVLTLGTGEIYYPPSGEYMITTGSQTVIQWWDPVGAIWRNYAGPNTWEQISTDGYNFRLINLSGVVVGANITNVGSGGVNGIGPNQTGSTVSFAAPAAGGVTATAQGYVVVGGTVAAPTVGQAGSGFQVPPLIVCDPPPTGGVQATFTATITAAGALSTITQVNPGAGYTSVPLFYIVPAPIFYQGSIRFTGDTPPTIPAPGLINPANALPGALNQPNIVSGTAGALLTPPAAVGGSGTLTAIVMTYFGDGYAGNAVPAVSFGGTSLGAAAATAIMSLCASGASVTATGGTTAVTNGTAISSLGLIAGTNDNNTFFPRPMRGLTTAAAGTFSVEDPGFGLQGGTVTVTYVGGATLATVTNTQMGGRSDTSIIQPMVQ